MDVFFLLPSEYLRGIVYLSDRSKLIDEFHKKNLEYLTQIIENKLTSDQKEDEKNQNFNNFKKKVQNLPQDSLIAIFLQYMSILFPEFRNESNSFCKTGSLDVRSQTLKIWRERFVKFNFQNKLLQIFRNKDKDQKSPKYSFSLEGYVIRWIDNGKYMISLDSINYKNRYKTFLFKAKQIEVLKDWFENFKFALNFEKFQEFEYFNKKDEMITVIEDFRKFEPLSALSDNSDDILNKRRYHSKSALTLNPQPSLLKPLKKQVAEDPFLKYTKVDRAAQNHTIAAAPSLNFEAKEAKTENFERSPLFPKEAIEIKLNELSETSKTSIYNAGNFFSEEESRLSEFEEHNSPLKSSPIKENVNIFHDSVYSATNFHNFDKIIENYNPENMLSESNYEMVSDQESFRIVQNLINEKKFKVFITLPYFIPATPSMFFEASYIKKWNQNISDYRLLSMLSSEKKLSVVYEERTSSGLFYFPRYFIYQRYVYTPNPDLTLVFCKSINYTKGEPPNISFRGNINFSLLSIAKVGLQTKISYFVDIDYKGFLSKRQHKRLVCEYLENFKNVRKFLENQFIMDFSECLNYPEKIFSDSKRPSLKPPNPNQETSHELQEIQLKKRKSSPNISAMGVEGDQSPQEKEFKRILQEITSNKHIINCIKQHKTHKKILGNRLQNDLSEYLFVQKYWHILASGKFEYLDLDILTKQMNLVNSQFMAAIQFKNFCLPMDCLDPLTELERLASLFSFAPLIFKDLSEFDKPLDLMKIVIIFIFSLLFLAISQKIPFSSFLGETYQAKIGDFTLYAEKTCENPDNSNILLINEFVVVSGKFRVNMDFGRNACRVQNIGYIQVYFKKKKMNFIATSFPSLIIEGIRELPRLVHYEGTLLILEKETCIVGEVKFANLSNIDNILTFKQNKEKFNEFFGQIFSVSRDLMGPISEGKLWKYKEKIKKECKVSGSLKDSIQFDEETYWSFDKHYPYYLENVESPLPSDSRFRKDILYYQMGIVQKAELEAHKLRGNERDKFDKKN